MKPPRPRYVVAVNCMVIAATACASFVVLGCDPPRDQAQDKVVGSHVCQIDCLAVPMGIKGLSFGMTLKQAKEALGGAKLRPRSSTKFFPSRRNKIEIPIKQKRRAWKNSVQPMPGVAVRVKTSLGTESATCRLEFAVHGALSHIECKLGSLRDKDKYASVFGTIRMRLETRHGAAERIGPVLRWGDDKATLLLAGQPGGRGVITLTNESKAHTDLIARMRQQADAAYATAIAGAIKAKADAAQRRADKATAAGKSWDRDLSGTAESNQ